MNIYKSYRSHITARFGEPVGTITLNGGFSCPNRDGTISRQGCLFCNNRSFSPAAEKNVPLLRQIEEAVIASRRYRIFLGYLQPFTNTYGPGEQLRAAYETVISHPRIAGLVVGTRPDCIDHALYHYFENLSHRTFLRLEIGLQSSHDTTLSNINRGHTWADFQRCIDACERHGIETSAHVILGLPGETPAMMETTARRLAALPVQGVKIHQLMIVAATPMEQLYRAGSIGTLSIEEYAPLLAGFLANLRADQYVQRIMADSRRVHGLIAPVWSERKAESIHFLRSWLAQKGIRQGMARNGATPVPADRR